MTTRGAIACVALLRAVNVGGNNKLPMKDLAGMFTALGCEAVETYIQSGNVVYRANAALAARIPTLVTRAIEERFGFQVPVVTRTVAELRTVVETNPFLSAGVEQEQLHVAFLADAPLPERIAQLDPQRSPPDAFAVRGRNVFLHYPNRVGRTKLTNAYLDAKLGTVSTVRNWCTVLMLLDMAEKKK
jgi:uncharacterized protein (DUF1697 family)